MFQIPLRCVSFPDLFEASVLEKFSAFSDTQWGIKVSCELAFVGVVH